MSTARFLGLKSEQLSTHVIDVALRQLGAGPALELSAHVLPRTCLSTLVRCGNDLVLVVDSVAQKQ